MIRKARPEDAVVVADIIFLAMEDILYQFIGKRDREIALSFLTDLLKQQGNQYSYENCWVAEQDGRVAGAVLVYDGAQLAALRMPVARMVRERFDRDFNPEDETGEGEWYIDSLGVIPEMQGRGIGSSLLAFLMDEYTLKQQITLGLLVDRKNPAAKKLYLKLGFKTAGEKTLVGKQLEHLQYQPA